VTKIADILYSGRAFSMIGIERAKKNKKEKHYDNLESKQLESW
jgi:hypothetical protein